MTYPPGVQPMGGSRPPFEDQAARTLERARHAMDGRQQRQALTQRERAEAREEARAERGVCRFCVGHHPLPNGPGCPRLASFELDGDGKVRAGTFFAGVKWAKGRVTFVEDTFEDSGGEESPDASQ